ncbi:hypothetical protein WJX73_006638 [Symbiochloris irregularis]|uniref:Large ribosomal subunit protein uL22c n=1 Tax=Symbiochloris irregularis TaxID=706552 RepID=A0AAW1NRY3_9CHLO
MALLWASQSCLPGPCVHRDAQQQLRFTAGRRPASTQLLKSQAFQVPVGQRACFARRQRLAVVAQAASPASKPQAEKPKEAVSYLRFTRGSTHKFRRVLDQIRGRSYGEALFLLEQLPYRACEPLKDQLIGVAADAKHNFQMSKARLFISECYADQAAIIKRFRPRAKGRGYRIKKGVSHITMKVREGKLLGTYQLEPPLEDPGSPRAFSESAPSAIAVVFPGAALEALHHYGASFSAART